MKYIGINPIKVEGSKFEIGYGYSKFVTLNLNNKSYTPVLNATVNTWGVDWKEKIKEKVFCRIEEKNNYLSIYSKCGNVEAKKYIAGYPSIKLGESLWGPYNSFSLGKLKEYTSMDISASWDFKTKGISNLAYDVWLTKNKSNNLTKDDVEVMVWLDYNFEPPWKDFGECGDFKVKYMRKNKDWDNGGHVFAFFYKKKVKKSSFDLIKLVDYCKKKVKSLGSYNIRTIELGTEFTKNSEVEARIKKLNFYFKKK